MKGLLVHTLRPAQDSTNGGISAKHNLFVLIDPDREIGPFEPSAENPALVLVRRHIGGEYLHAELPAPHPEKMVGPMFGGNFVTSSDSRFPGRYPIPVHDRYDTWENHEILSR